MLEDAQGAIADTIHGMRQLLEHERVRKAEVKPEMRAVRLADLMSGLARQFAAEAERMGLHLTVDVPAKAVVHTDSVLVSIVLRNLIGNAIKYSSNGTVRMTGERRNCGASGSSRWVLAVSDEGPGIRTGGREHLFEAFRRGDVHGEEGVGLGLAIASKAAKLLGAELTVESEIGIGSTFALAFPPER